MQHSASKQRLLQNFFPPVEAALSFEVPTQAPCFGLGADLSLVHMSLHDKLFGMEKNKIQLLLLTRSVWEGRRTYTESDHVTDRRGMFGEGVWETLFSDTENDRWEKSGDWHTATDMFHCAPSQAVVLLRTYTFCVNWILTYKPILSKQERKNWLRW